MTHPVLQKSEVQKNSSLILTIAGGIGILVAAGGLLPAAINGADLTAKGLIWSLFGLALSYVCFKEVATRIASKTRDGKTTDQQPPPSGTDAID
ncbi:hypothetical protein [Chitinolyticbacter albus]|uniref:hypothetical protein n=1 Tax=Chitinolyticbacter albus TaxID=2961951 RepID=UPI00210A3318|nr:hypothetical protein [Chitinolyticbacter albus]